MKRRKIAGIILLIGTVCYLLASLLALYQNQRVKIEKGIEEALKAYSEREGLNVKELSKDFNLLLDEKVDVSEANRQSLKYEGSFATMEKSINSVTNEVAMVEYNYNYLNERMENVESFYNAFYDEVVTMNTVYEEKITEINNHITEIKTELKMVQKGILEIESRITANEQKQKDDIKILQEQINLAEQRIVELEENALHYQYDGETKTLNVFGRKEEISDKE